MATELTKTQADRLGDRLRKGHITEADLRLLDHYRRSFTEAYEVVVDAIRDELGLEPTGRPAKSTTSISDKLHRESIRLSQTDFQESWSSLRRNLFNALRDDIKFIEAFKGEGDDISD